MHANSRFHQNRSQNPTPPPESSAAVFESPRPHQPRPAAHRSRKTSFFKKSARKTKVGEKFQSSGEFGGRRRPCVYRKPRFGNIGDEGRDNRSKVVRFAGLKPE